MTKKILFLLFLAPLVLSTFSAQVGKIRIKEGKLI